MTADPTAPTDPLDPPPAPIGYNDCGDCPYMLPPMITGMNADAYRDQPDMAVALGGRYYYTYSTYHFDPVVVDSTSIADGFTSKTDGAFAVTAHATRLGKATLTVTSHAPYHDTEVVAPESSTIDVLPIAEVRFDLPRYRPLDAASPLAPVIVGSSFTGAVRLVADDGRFLADDSLTITGEGATTQRFDAFAVHDLAPGRHVVTVQGDSLAPLQLAFQVIEHVDRIELTDTPEPAPSYYHLVCAHAFTDGDEVLTEWKMDTVGAPWIPADAGNCVEVVVFTDVGTVTFVAGDGSSKQLVTRPGA